MGFSIDAHFLEWKLRSWRRWPVAKSS